MKENIQFEVIDNYSVLEEGDTISVEKRPVAWSSRLHGSNPISFGKDAVEYPYNLTIEKIQNRHMTCGKYGWSLHDIVIAGCVRLIKEDNDFEEIEI